MISKKKALEIIQDSFDSLFRSGMIDEKVIINENTPILGDSSVLDSIAFVTHFADLEDRLINFIGDDIYLVLDEINEFDINSPTLNAGIISSYIEDKTRNLNDK